MKRRIQQEGWKVLETSQKWREPKRVQDPQGNTWSISWNNEWWTKD